MGGLWGLGNRQNKAGEETPNPHRRMVAKANGLKLPTRQCGSGYNVAVPAEMSVNRQGGGGSREAGHGGVEGVAGGNSGGKVAGMLHRQGIQACNGWGWASTPAMPWPGMSPPTTNGGNVS